ncbi:MAG TPA: 30S ribosomal protein S19 [Candidatus Brocadiia bacterium]|nr:30S ribosomal protein S19 [Planctomycetota bacterium]MBI4008189.1 30S ribosomal protein S19 [Planctomycetota bacterium]MDO8092461.1 30S ribosomal protein S19 [Candidatus Brocadiales bacterium]
MGRSVKKAAWVDPKLMKKVLKQKDTGIKDPIRTWSRSSTIIPEFVSYTFLIHNGKVFHKLFVTEDMVGHKLGEFALTRTFRGHGGVKKKETKISG